MQIVYLCGIIIVKEAYGRNDVMSLKETAEALVECLEKIYPDALCSLTYKEPYELMIAGRLSAQCTDIQIKINIRLITYCGV